MLLYFIVAYWCVVSGILRYQVDLQQLEELEEGFEDFDLGDYD